MSETAKHLFEELRNAARSIAPGLASAGSEINAELSRLGKQGANELAGALFKNDAFVPYGPGQYTPSVEHEAHSQDKSHEMHLERDGHER